MLLMMMMIVGMVGLVVEAAVLAVEHADVAEPPLAGSAAPITALIVRTGLGLVTLPVMAWTWTWPWTHFWEAFIFWLQPMTGFVSGCQA